MVRRLVQRFERSVSSVSFFFSFVGTGGCTVVYFSGSTTRSTYIHTYIRFEEPGRRGVKGDSNFFSFLTLLLFRLFGLPCPWSTNARITGLGVGKGVLARSRS